MASRLGRARRARRQYNTSTPALDPATEHNSAADPTASMAGAVHSDAAVSDPAAPTPQRGVPEPDVTADLTAAQPDPASGSPIPRTRIGRTMISGAWVAAIVAVVGLVFLLIFILENLTRADVYFLGASGTLPIGVAMLFAAVAGALLMALVGSARILQLRRAARRRRQ